MRPEEILPNLVELSIAVAGFSGVVAGIGSKRLSEWTPTAQLLFSALLVSTLATTALSVFAMVLLSTPLLPETAWATISATHAFVLIGIVWLRARQFRAAERGIGLLERRRFMAFLGSLLTLAALQLAIYAGHVLMT